MTTITMKLEDKKVHCDMEGQGKDLCNLFAQVMYRDRDIELIIRSAIHTLDEARLRLNNANQLINQALSDGI